MKYKKFKELVAIHPWILKRLIDWVYLGKFEIHPKDSPQRKAKIECKLKELVRKELSYIAFRPFSTLDLSSGSQLLKGQKDMEFSPTKTDQSIFFVILYHIEGENTSSRSHLVGFDSGNSIKECIEYLQATVGVEAYAQGKAFIVDRVWREDCACNQALTVCSISIQIYECPAGCGLNLTPPLRRPPPVDEATLAYIRGTPMPPIVPGEFPFPAA